MISTLSALQLCRGYTTGHVRQEILKNLNVELFSGQLTLVMGPSGSGKTTLLALLGGLLRPDAGEVNALGSSIGRMSDEEREQFRLRNAGFIFQGFNLFPSLTALEQVLLPLRYLPNPPEKPHAAALHALEEVGLADKAHLRPAALSGGEKQRVAIARGMVKHPALLFADEPTSALDTANAVVVTQMLQKLAHERKATVLCVTHDTRLQAYADRVLHLQDGIIFKDEPGAGLSPTAVSEKTFIS